MPQYNNIKRTFIKINIPAITLLMIMSVPANGEQSTSSTGQYNIDLNRVYGAMKGIIYMKEICANSYPIFKNQNEVSYKLWRSKYIDFIQEIEGYFTERTWEQSGNDPQKHMGVLNTYNVAMDEYKKAMKAQMQNSGETNFRKTCEVYPNYLSNNRTDLEYFYAEQVKTIRQGVVK